MTDNSVDKEIEENNRRKEAMNDDEGGTMIDSVEDAFAPITDSIRRADDDENEEDVDRRTAGNDTDQR